MSEQKRGCGYRKIGGLYLVSDPGFQLECDGLPLELQRCECCGFIPPFSRNLQRVNPEYIKQAEHKHHMNQEKEHPEHGYCSCFPVCPICYPENQAILSFGLMFVGKKSYTPQSFIKEAMSLGISKRIPEIPNWLIMGETWVFLAHQKVPKVSLEELKTNGMRLKEPEYMSAIFYGFKPQRIEMPVWKGDLTDAELLKLEEKGITPVLLDPTPENKKKHKTAQAIAKHLDRYLEGD
jgi:hypothetical protein